MKFSSSLKFNAVAEWWDEYIAYSALKKYIFQLEKQYHDSTTLGGAAATDLEATDERTSLLLRTTTTNLLHHNNRDEDEHGNSAQFVNNRDSRHLRALQSADKIFSGLLDKELEKIVRFYRTIEADLHRDMVALESDVAMKDAQGASPTNSGFFDEDDEEDEEDEEDGKGRSASGVRRQRTASPSDVRYSISDYYGELGGLSPTSAANPHGNPLTRGISATSAAGGASTSRRRNRMPSDAAATQSKSTLANLFDKVVPRRRSVSGGGGVTDLLIPPASSTGGPYNVWNAKSTYARDVRMLFKRRITNLYNTAVGLRAYAELNFSGFRKILKKYDKVLESDLQRPYLQDKVEKAYPWLPETKAKLEGWITTLHNFYAKCVTHGDQVAAEKQLQLYQREQVVWERDTVWRQMIAQERRGEIGDGPKAIGESTSKQGKKPVLIDFESRYFGRVRISKRVLYFAIALGVLVGLLVNPVLDRPEPSNCFAILCFATVLWATEAIPLFVTSILVPFLLCIFRVIRSQDEFDQRLTTSQATKYIFSVMFSPTIMLLIGGFTIASALSKTNIDRVLITRVLSFAGTRPSTVLLSFMIVSCFASMWISNVAAPTLCFTLIRPILRTLPPKSSFAPCLILAIALAANIGGQSSPISSPQNLIVLQHMDPPLDWLEWFSVALPVSGLSIILIWVFLLLSYKPARAADGSLLEIKPIRASKEKFTKKQYWVSFVCIVTIGLWCVEHSIEEWVGDMGLVAIIPIVAFFSTGVLKKDDFEQFLWSIVFIAMGGSALGKAVQASKLLEAMDIVIRDMIQGLSFYVVIIVLSAVVLVISTFISHTIASVLLVPIAAEVGANLPEPHPNLLMFLTGLICSTGMGMPVSGFPNQTAATQTDDMGELYLTNVDFLKNGVPASIIATVVVATLGFVLMKAIGLQ